MQPLEPGETDYSHTSVGMTDADLRNTMLSSIRLLAILSLVVMALFWWKSGWSSALLVIIGAAISMASLWEWLRLMTALMERMDAGDAARPMGGVLIGFFIRLGLTVVILYVSLKALHGSVFALAAGLGLGVFCLTVEVLRRLKH